MAGVGTGFNPRGSISGLPPRTGRVCSRQTLWWLIYLPHPVDPYHWRRRRRYALNWLVLRALVEPQAQGGPGLTAAWLHP